MKRSRFTDEQIIAIVKEQEAYPYGGDRLVALRPAFDLSGAFKGLAKDRGGSADGGYHWI